MVLAPYLPGGKDSIQGNLYWNKHLITLAKEYEPIVLAYYQRLDTTYESTS